MTVLIFADRHGDVDDGVDINDAESLDKIFKLVTNILSSFFSPLTLKLIKIIVSFIFCPRLV